MKISMVVSRVETHRPDGKWEPAYVEVELEDPSTVRGKPRGYRWAATTLRLEWKGDQPLPQVGQSCEVTIAFGA